MKKICFLILILFSMTTKAAFIEVRNDSIESDIIHEIGVEYFAYNCEGVNLKKSDDIDDYYVFSVNCLTKSTDSDVMTLFGEYKNNSIVDYGDIGLANSDYVNEGLQELLGVVAQNSTNNVVVGGLVLNSYKWKWKKLSGSLSSEANFAVSKFKKNISFRKGINVYQSLNDDNSGMYLVYAHQGNGKQSYYGVAVIDANRKKLVTYVQQLKIFEGENLNDRAKYYNEEAQYRLDKLLKNKEPDDFRWTEVQETIKNINFTAKAFLNNEWEQNISPYKVIKNTKYYSVNMGSQTGYIRTEDGNQWYYLLLNPKTREVYYTLYRWSKDELDFELDSIKNDLDEFINSNK